MDDDTKYYTIQVKGIAYRFRPLDPSRVTNVVIVNAIGAKPEKILRALTKALEESAGADQWDALTDRLIVNEVTIEDLVGVFKRLAERQAKDAEQTGARGLDVASREFRPSDAP